MVSSVEALHRAVRSLTNGPGDPTSIEGAKVNALESIAWSLVGLLAKQLDDNALEDLTEAFQGLGIVNLSRS